MPALEGRDIFEALLGDPTFVAEAPQSTHAVWREFCEEMPRLFADDLSKLVTVQVLFDAKMAVLKHILNNGWLRRMIDAYPPEVYELLGSDGMVELAESALGSMLEVIPQIVGDVPAWLTALGITEEIFLAHPKGGRFNEMTLVRWRDGGLTLEELLRIQPNVILKNTD